MSSAALADLTGPGATADDALVQAALAMVFMANQLQNIEDQSREEMLNTATSLVEGIGNIIKSAVVVDEKEIEPIPTEPPEFPNFYGDDPSPEEIEEYEAQQALIKQQKVDYAEKAARLISTLGMSIINVVSITVRSTQVVGEPSLLLPSEFLTIELHRDEPEGFQRKEILGTVGSFQLPTAEALFKDSIADTYVDVETTSFAGNPYSWDPTRSKVKSGVIGLNFIDSDGNMMDISGLEESVGFLLDNDPTLLPQWDTVLLDFSQPEDLYRHNFEVKNKDNTVQIVILPTTDIPLKLYIKFNEPPSFQDHLFSCDLPRHVNNSNNLWEDLTGELKYSCQVPPEKLLHTGKYYIGVKIPDNIREITGTEFANYSMMVFSSSCLFWHENEERWSDEGCKVGDLTTTQATHCLCSHLTSFASDFFVPPNSIDFSTVFNKFDLRENSAVFATVFALLGVYFILLIWARRKDKKDIEKWGVTPLADNNPSDKYFYEIAVYTGMRRGAGTRSKVSFMLSGDDEDTGIRNLDDNKRKLFQTGSIDHFVMAVSSSLGPLAYLRIWHDDSGKGQHGSWYLSRIMITDLQTGEIFYFLCDKWLAVEYDDGLIDRVLPVAGREDLTNFNQLFYHTARKNLSEKHLWFSVLSRPSKSHFTRVQRLTCCLSLLYCSMIASAMWFRSEVRAKNVFSVTIGPFTLTSFELYVGVMTNLVVFPINFIIVEIFRRSRPGTISLSKWINRRKTRPESAKFDILFNDTEEKQQTSKKTKKKKTLPHWCLYLGWFICILTVVTSAFFVILYSMEWGADKSEQWLVSIILSFSLSVLVTQPVQVIMIAIFFSCFMKKVTDDDDETGKTSVKANGLKHDEEYLHGPNNDNADRKGKAYVLPPKGDKLEALRKERLNEIQMQSVIREIALYGVFVIVLLSLCYTNRDPNSYVMTNSIHQIFFETEHKMARIKFDGLSRTSPDIFWDWMEESMIPGLYSEKYYNGDEMHWRHKRFIKNRESYRVGPARLRQLRVPPVNCDIEDPMDSVIFNCTTDYKIYSNEETRHFDIGWTSLNLTGVNLTSFTSEVNSPWIYHTASELNGLPVLGHQTLYGGGGYIATLETTMEKSHELVSYLRNNSWYDKFTRAIFVELTVYNANVNLFSLVTFLIELPTLGGGLLSPTISTFRLYNYVGLAAIFVILAQVVYVFFVAYFLIHELLKIRKEKKKYFKSFWNCLELVLVVFAITVIAMYVFRQIFTTLALKDVREDHFKFVNFQHLAYWDTIFTWILAITLFIAVLKFLKLLRFNKRMSMLGMTLKNCFRDLLYFSVIWIIVFLAYCQVFYLVFGTSLMDYASMSVTMATQISMMLGRFDYHALNEINRVFSKIFFFFFILCLYWILMNMFLTILNQSIHAVKNDISRQSNEYEIVEFIWRRFVQFIGVSGNRGPTVTRHKIPKVKIQGPDSPKEGATSNSDFSEEAFIRSIDRLVGYVLRHYGDIDVVRQNEGKEWTMAISLKNGKSNKKTKKALTTS
ncbi:polycystin-1-like protein 2 [Ptychodera flava]|uniref:polycystin-1-like protein 2 n=1 Tax=Ptychodera flava TaxID=63121 RepID=UPI00396A9FB1